MFYFMLTDPDINYGRVFDSMWEVMDWIDPDGSLSAFEKKNVALTRITARSKTRSGCINAARKQGYRIL